MFLNGNSGCKRLPLSLIGLFGLVPAAFFLVPKPPQEIEPGHIVYIGLFGSILLAGLIRWTLLKTAIPGGGRVLRPFLLFCTIVLLSMPVSFLNGTRPGDIFRGLVPFLNMAMFPVILLYFPLPQGMKALHWLLRITAVLLCASVFTSVAPGISSAMGGGNYHDIRSSLGDGAFSTLTIMLPAYFMGRYAINGFAGKLDVCILLGLLAVVIFSFLRSAIVSLVLISAGLVYFFGNARLWAKRIVILALLALTVIPILGTLSDGFSGLGDLIYGAYANRFEKSTDDTNPHIQELKAVFENLGPSLIMGNGLGYRWTYVRSLSGGSAQIWEGGFTHNMFTYILLDFGLAGLLAFLWLLLSLWKEWRFAFRIATPEIKKELIPLISGMAGMLLYAQFQTAFRSVNFLLLFSIFAGAIACTNHCLRLNLKYRKYGAGPHSIHVERNGAILQVSAPCHTNFRSRYANTDGLRSASPILHPFPGLS